jgi:hypothetical protein
MNHENYIYRTHQLLRSFDRAIFLGKPIMAARYGDESSALIKESRQKYIGLIPQIPYIGEKNPLVDIFYLPATRHLAIYKAFQEHNKPVEEVGKLAYEIGELEISTIPVIVRRLIGSLWFSRWFTRRLQKRAADSRERRYPGGYLVAYTKGDGIEFDYEFAYIECAVYHFFRQQGAAELVPYLCAIDKTASELMGWGLRRTMTLADGGEKCDFRFKKNGETCVAIPQSLKKV